MAGRIGSANDAVAAERADQFRRSRELEEAETEMSKPRPIVAGEVVSVTRRTMARKFLLKPDPWVEAAFGYLLALYATRLDIGVVAGVVMSDHYHLLVVDRSGRLPTLMNELNAAMARVVNAMRGREGAVWDERQPHYQVMLDPQVALSMAAYQLANPVAAGLVEHGRDWPGFRTTPNAVGRTLRFARPAALESEAGTYPEVATLELVAPPGWGVGGAARFGAELAALVAQREELARREVRAAGREFEGVRRVLAAPWTTEATAPSDSRKRGARVAAATDEARLAAYVSGRKRFVRLHAEAKELFVAGVREVLFPFGTWLMRVLFRASVAEAPG
ncbi:MAG: hypothetical protein U1F43_24695 [Myxococcota bacterium]